MSKVSHAYSADNPPFAHHWQAWSELLSAGLQDDGWQWDWTAAGSVRPAGKPARARVIAKSPGVWAADGLIEALNRHPWAELGGSRIVARGRVKDGAALRPGETVCEWRGPAQLVLAFERPFLNLASYAGGIATLTRQYVDAVRAACPRQTPRVTSTRKTLPGYRDIAIRAVQAGGGFSHRISLSGGVLIKENHIAAAGGIARAIEGVRAIAPHSLRIEIEVRDGKELAQAIAAGAEVVMLDNFTPAQVAVALERVRKLPRRPVLEVSGGLTLSNIAQYAQPGVDILSVGSLTHSAKAIDLSLLVGG
ncbi:MAG: carboxylating nicotinate-nucleotide diphosphorylase [Oligoflexia bacterium]|nr:carboxylating nicotinate-nucleotide diphosphorylase [Oligoflexia bacterium]